MKVAAIECPRCQEQVWSRHRHDFRHCKCGYCFIDGGRDYTRTGYGVPYPHEGTPEEKDYAVTETNRIGPPKMLSLDVDLPPPTPRQRSTDWDFPGYVRPAAADSTRQEPVVGQARSANAKKSTRRLSNKVPRVPSKTGKKK